MPKRDRQSIFRHRLTGREKVIHLPPKAGQQGNGCGPKISVKTADTTGANIMRKLNLHSVSALVRYAIRNNIAQVSI